MKKEDWTWKTDAGMITFHTRNNNEGYSVKIDFGNDKYIQSKVFSELGALIAWSVGIVGNYMATYNKEDKNV